MTSDMKKGRPEHRIVLSFGLDHAIVSPRIVEVANPYPDHYMHHIHLETADDIDDELMNFITIAPYVFPSIAYR